MSNVLVIDQKKQPCQPVHPAQARRLLSAGHATVYRRFPFVIRLKTVQHQPTQPLRLKFDPGAKTTGIAIVHDRNGQWYGRQNSRTGERPFERSWRSEGPSGAPAGAAILGTDRRALPTDGAALAGCRLLSRAALAMC